MVSFDRLAPENVHGLSQAEADTRLRTYGPNELPRGETHGFWRVVADVLTEPMLVLLLVIGSIYLMLGNHSEAIILFAFVNLVIVITLVQKNRAERSLAQLRELSSPRALVIRDGTKIRIAARDLVPGDIVILSEGDRVPADVVMRTALDLMADESLLTGEAVPVTKIPWDGKRKATRPGGNRQPFAFASTVITRGLGMAQVTATGAHTEVGKIGLAIAGIPKEPTHLEKDISKLVMRLAYLSLAVCVAAVALYGILRGNWIEALLNGLSLSMALVPEEIPVVLIIFLALGAWRLSKSSVLTRRMGAIETLGAVTVLCMDKTGTLTMNHMRVTWLSTADGHEQTLETSVQPDRRFDDLVGAAQKSSLEISADPMERAIREIPGGSAKREDLKTLSEQPVSSSGMVRMTVYGTNKGGYYIAAKGAPEEICMLCHVPQAKRKEIMGEVARRAAEGLRILGVASADGPQSPRTLSRESATFRFRGLIGFSDPLRTTAAQAIRECRKAGIRPVIVTGDYAGTAKYVAREVGVERPGDVLTGEDLDGMNDVELADAVGGINVFARIQPTQKYRLVEALKAQDAVVAMTGDGVNDAPALKAADVGIAMGKYGTDVAREASALVLLDDDICSIVESVRTGRHIFDNIMKAASYIIAIHVPIASMTLLPLFLGGPLVLLPSHIALLELIIDPACSVVFEAEPPEERVMERRPRDIRAPFFTARSITFRVLQGAMVALVTGAVYIGVLFSRWPEADIRTVTTLAIIASNISLIVSNLAWGRQSLFAMISKNPALPPLFAAVAIVMALVYGTPFLRSVFHVAPVTVSVLIIALTAGLLSYLLAEVIEALDRRSVFG